MTSIDAMHSNLSYLKNNPQAPQEPQTTPAPKPNMNSTDTVSFKGGVKAEIGQKAAKKAVPFLAAIGAFFGIKSLHQVISETGSIVSTSSNLILKEKMSEEELKIQNCKDAVQDIINLNNIKTTTTSTKTKDKNKLQIFKETFQDAIASFQIKQNVKGYPEVPVSNGDKILDIISITSNSKLTKRISHKGKTLQYELKEEDNNGNIKYCYYSPSGKLCAVFNLEKKHNFIKDSAIELVQNGKYKEGIKLDDNGNLNFDTMSGGRRINVTMNIRGEIIKTEELNINSPNPLIKNCYEYENPL